MRGQDDRQDHATCATHRFLRKLFVGNLLAILVILECDLGLVAFLERWCFLSMDVRWLLLLYVACELVLLVGSQDAVHNDAVDEQDHHVADEKHDIWQRKGVFISMAVFGVPLTKKFNRLGKHVDQRHRQEDACREAVQVAENCLVFFHARNPEWDHTKETDCSPDEHHNNFEVLVLDLCHHALRGLKLFIISPSRSYETFLFL